MSFASDLFKRASVGLITVLTAAGCGVFNQCSNKCPVGFKHDVFCGCWKPEPEKTGGGGQSGNPTALNPEWVCPFRGSATEFESWQPDSGFGSNMNSLIGKTVPFASRACRLDAIPFLLQAANCELSASGDPLCVTPGTKTVMTVSTVIRRTNLINGGVAWGVRGTLKDNVALDAPSPSWVGQTDPVAGVGVFQVLASAVSGFEYSTNAIANSLPSVSFDTGGAPAPLSCNLHCQKQDEFCAVTTVDQVDLARWQQLLNQLNAKPTQIAKQDLMAAASSEKDLCSRSDLSITLDGRFANEGDSCTMDIQFEDGRASVSLPPKLAGAFSFQAAGAIDVTFASASESPAVDFTDKEVHEEFGGLITGMALASRSLTVSTSSGKCIQLRR